MDARGRGCHRPMGVGEEHALDFPHVCFGNSPVVIAHHLREIDDGVAGYPAGEVDVWIEVTERERTGGCEDGLPPVQTRIARPRHRTPSSAAFVDEHHVIQGVDRFEAQDERRVAVPFHHRRGEERRLETVRRFFAHDAPKAAKGGATMRFLVIRKMIKVTLHETRRPQPRDQPALMGCEEDGSRLQIGEFVNS